MKRNQYIVILLITLISASSGFTQYDGGWAGEFLRWGVGGRAIGMGRAYLALANDATAPYWNPAGLFVEPEIGCWGISFSHIKLFGESCFGYVGAKHNYDFKNLVKPLENLISKKPAMLVSRALGLLLPKGVGYVYFSTGDIQEWTGDFNSKFEKTGKVLDFSSNALLISWAWRLTYLHVIDIVAIDIGVTHKILKNRVPYTAWRSDKQRLGRGWDFGFRMQFVNCPIYLAAVFQNIEIGSDCHSWLSLGPDDIPFTTRLGLGFSQHIRKDCCLHLAADYENMSRREDGWQQLKTGGEVQFQNLKKFGSISISDFSIRFGYNRQGGLVAGLGLGLAATNDLGLEIDLSSDTNMGEFYSEIDPTYQGGGNFTFLQSKLDKWFKNDTTCNAYRKASNREKKRDKWILNQYHKKHPDSVQCLVRLADFAACDKNYEETFEKYSQAIKYITKLEERREVFKSSFSDSSCLRYVVSGIELAQKDSKTWEEIAEKCKTLDTLIGEKRLRSDYVFNYYCAEIYCKAGSLLYADKSKKDKTREFIDQAKIKYDSTIQACGSVERIKPFLNFRKICCDKYCIQNSVEFKSTINSLKINSRKYYDPILFPSEIEYFNYDNFCISPYAQYETGDCNLKWADKYADKMQFYRKAAITEFSKVDLFFPYYQRIIKKSMKKIQECMEKLIEHKK